MGDTEQQEVAPPPVATGGVRWKEMKQSGDLPPSRSGHTMTFIGNQGYCFGGVDSAKPPGPNNDVFKMDVRGANCSWKKLDPSGERPTPRWRHSAACVDNEKLVIFGGFQDNSTRLNDVFVYDTMSDQWSQPRQTRPKSSGGAGGIASSRRLAGRVGRLSGPAVSSANSARGMFEESKDPSESKTQGMRDIEAASAMAMARASLGSAITTPSLDGCPSPRGAHTAVVIRRRMWVFGGYGGSGYARQDFNDLYALNIDDMSWDPEVVHTASGEPPARRSAHSAFAKDNMMFIYGGWNSSENFTDIHIFNTENYTWSQCDTLSIGIPPRWNHSSVSVTAVPNWQAFVFGGSVHDSTDDDSELGGSLAAPPDMRNRRLSRHRRRSSRTQGNFSNDVLVMTLDSNQLAKVAAASPVLKAQSSRKSVGDSSTVGGEDEDAYSEDGFDEDGASRPGTASAGAGAAAATPSASSSSSSSSSSSPAEVSTKPAGPVSPPMLHWRHLELASEAEAPRARSDTCLAYDENGKRLIVFGGWADRWLGDVHTLDVGDVVGPPYAVLGVSPELGPATGSTTITIHGMGFKPEGSRISPSCTVRFTLGRKHVDVSGTVTSPTTIEVVTPSIEAWGAGQVSLTVSVNSLPYTITSTEFTVFHVTDPINTIAYGPGLISGCRAGHPTIFRIRARDVRDKDRFTGSDEWNISVVPADDRKTDEDEVITATIKDNQNGTYDISYTAPTPGLYKVDVEFDGTFGGAAGPVSQSPWLVEFQEEAPDDHHDLTGPLVVEHAKTVIRSLATWTKSALATIQKKVPEDSVNTLLEVKAQVQEVEETSQDKKTSIECMKATLAALTAVKSSANQRREFDRMSKQLDSGVKALSASQQHIPVARAAIQPLVKRHAVATKNKITEFEDHIKSYAKSVEKLPFWEHGTGHRDSVEALDEADGRLARESKEAESMEHLATMLDLPGYVDESKRTVAQVAENLVLARRLWDIDQQVDEFLVETNRLPFSEVNADALEDSAKSFHKKMKKDMNKTLRASNLFKGLDKKIKDFLSTCPLISSLTHKSMRDRHWQMMMDVTGKTFTPPTQDSNMKVESLVALNLHEFSADVEEITDRAIKEEKMEVGLTKLVETWHGVVLVAEPYVEGNDEVMTLRMSEDDFEMLENDQLIVQGMMASRFLATFEKDVTTWQRDLSTVGEVMLLLGEIQRTWSYLEPLFMGSEEVKRELPDTAKAFASIDTRVKSILKQMGERSRVLPACCADKDLLPQLEQTSSELEACKKALTDFLDGKRRLFPRFYFVSEADLLDILSNGSTPAKIVHHVTKVLLATATLELDETTGGRPNATRWVSCVGIESVDIAPPLRLEGKVETYMQALLDSQKNTLRDTIKTSLERYSTQSRPDWLMQKDESGRPMDPAQVALQVSGLRYVTEVEQQFDNLAAGNPQAMQEQYQELIEQLNDLIRLTQTDLDRANRQRVMTMITLDAHSRDVIHKLVREKVNDKTMFQWQSQLKHRFDGKDAFVSILDASLKSGYEYLGNGPRLVITPLTDRIYVTATQALNLKMGCAPAGPAGTGKTETTKDLASACAKCCYVFNCSPEMDYRSMGNIFKGLAASGSWGCFDEFNRLVPEVLSVCSVQFKAVCDAIRLEKEKATIEGDDVTLDPTCGVYITMNPGYIGRAELPEGLKALFRPMTVMVPDLVLICENMLMAEGFIEAKVLASKFYGLYSLLRELLSKQSHYDWGLRAVKSVLVVAGAFKRAEPELEEQALLMRALRDFNTPKIVQQDEVVFFGLLGDLFPGVDPPRKVDPQLEDAVTAATKTRGLHPEPDFLLKAVQLQELLAIRHCVFVMGPPGAGKTETWRTLATARSEIGEGVKVVDLNPKAVSTEELYGYITLATREWRDGLLSKIMRDLGQENTTTAKWILLDGDLDANWIESMNSVMDDNKTLTLASNERVPLKSHMRMIFEIRDLVYATPATVSRAGIIYISTDKGTQWQSLIASWISKLVIEKDQIRTAITSFFDKYCADTLLFIRKECKPLVHLESMNLVTTLLRMLDCLLPEETLAKIMKQETSEAIRTIETCFVFAALWAFGCSFSEKDGEDYRAKFSDYWRGEYKSVRLPNRETVFDYWLDPETLKFEPWKQSPYFTTIDFDSATMSMTEVTVPTPETCSISYWLQNLVENRVPCMLVGMSGCGKTALIKGLLQDQDAERRLSTTINFNFYTNSAALQATLEAPLEKKTGSTYGPKGKAQLIYFVDDLNLPEVDPYNTQSAIALLRQHIDHGHWYDRTKLLVRNVQSCQYLACMNPTAGSFEINPRLQRHFVTFAVGFPGPTSLHTIYNTFLNGHLRHFSTECQSLAGQLVNAALHLHGEVAGSFRKSAVNFHYEFNIRHLSNVFQGLLVAQPAQFSDPSQLVMLWLHESERVYGDRLVSIEDLGKYYKLAASESKKRFPSVSVTNFFTAENSDPLVFCHFATTIQEREYDRVTSMPALRVILEDALREYNEMYVTMNLVLFDDAIKHVCRISRIVLNPAGHALLVGVGGSGKQSLSRLAAYICGYTVSQIVISGTYGLSDLKEDLKAMYMKAGVKEEGVMFLFTDSQITNERFLVYLNDLLASGNIPDLFALEERDEIIGSLSARVKEAGIIPEAAAVWDFFIAEVRKNLHVVLSFSPVGDDFRTRAKRFPALVNSTVIDWFQPWPREALLSVGKKFLAEIDLGSDEVRAGVEAFIPFSFEEVNNAARQFLTTNRRYVYTTPKSYLELLKLYAGLLATKREEMGASIDRLANGLQKLQDTAEAVNRIEEDLKVSLEDAEQKRLTSEGIAAEVSANKAIVEEETAKATIEATKCAKIQEEVSEMKASAEEDLAKAEPAVIAAMAALDTLNKKDLGECKTMSTPPKGVDDVFGAVCVLLAGCESNIIVQKNGKVREKDRNWDASKKALLSNVTAFIDTLKGFKSVVDAGKVPDINWKEVRPFLAMDHFNSESIMSKNRAAAGVVSWVINIVMYRDIIVTVEPKRQALREANDKLDVASKQLEAVQAKVAELQATLDKLTAELNAANAEKQAAIDQVENGQKKLDLATRLTSALADENVRWAEGIKVLNAEKELLVGDVLLAAAFISYIGPFTKNYRQDLMSNKYLPFLEKAAGGQRIPMSAVPNPRAILCTEATVAEWNSQGLPSDRVSTENACIVTSTARWPLLIDPQLQGITWVREKERTNDLQIVRLGQKNMLTTLERAIDAGTPVLIENMGERIDAVLMPVIARATIKKGHKEYIMLGDKEVEFHPNFRLYLHTKLSNPHYPPEIQAEAALVNFTVTEAGLEDQLLTMVVEKERPDLAKLRTTLIEQQNHFKIKMKKLEDDILQRLAAAEGDLTEDVDLILGLEDTKRISRDIAEKQKIAAVTEIEINTTSEKYRPVAARGSLLFFLMNELFRVHTYYIYSLSAFVTIFLRSIDVVSGERDPMREELLLMCEEAEEKSDAEEDEDEDEEDDVEDDITDETDEGKAEEGEEGSDSKLPEGKDSEETEKEEEVVKPVIELDDEQLGRRCGILQDSVTSVAFQYVNRGLFETDKLTVATQMCFKILVAEGLIAQETVDVLAMGTSHANPGPMGPLSDWMPEVMWPRVKSLEAVPELSKLGDTMQEFSDAWRTWFDCECPDETACPGAFKTISDLDRLCLLRAMRPDRLPAALRKYVAANLGDMYVSPPLFDMAEAYEETNVQTPVFFVLFPGVDPTVWVENLGKKLGFTEEGGRFINISMGQGQEKPAEEAIAAFARDGGWVMLQNVHLMQSWLPTLERKLEVAAETSHPDFRCFISAEPPPLAYLKNMPESMMQSCIKVSQEAPADLKSNLTRAWATFSQDVVDQSTKPAEFKSCLFTLCFYHAIVLGRRRFGQQGWSKRYSFNNGDLTVCANVLMQYINANPSVPWDDLRYIFGQIMYGGHITDAWDRRTNNTYLEVYFRSEILDGLELAPSLKCPDGKALSYADIANYIETDLPVEAPPMFGLHPNAEIGYLTNYAEDLFQTIVILGGSGGGGGSNVASGVGSTIDDLLERLPEDFQMIDIKLRAEPVLEEPTEAPYALVALQECERMNVLLTEIRRTLIELRKGMDGQLNMTEAMEDLQSALSINQVPGRNVFHKTSWEVKAWPSKKSLSSWFADLLMRVEQLERWTTDLMCPLSLWLPGLFNPMAFVTAIMQVTARDTGLPLDKMAVETHITTLTTPDQATAPPEHGKFAHGLFLEGARWESSPAVAGDPVIVGNTPTIGFLADSHLKELMPQLPLVYLRAVPVEKSWEPTEVGYLRHDPNVYEAPLYSTSFRGPTYVLLATLNTRDPVHKWIRAGVAVIMSTDN